MDGLLFTILIILGFYIGFAIYRYRFKRQTPRQILREINKKYAKTE
ncbi:hypothetical protein LEP1GSC062_4261 [Leptospira alexanderi serovar Manhao 3 str. L 60]|uniref:Uncharacterized protein n=1 Tax=Leptospira alexanderi serovar Manhao 3 str. L 60 TaxID=1049759 RepID=V6HY39_9LEPT|nr:hypothetical protein LEP1GSC062_4261 [Leptospira alexanderi serovar Manhao 3 str. L 60]